MTRFVDTTTATNWSFLTQDDHERWRQRMVEDLWNDGQPQQWDPEPEVMEAIRARTDRIAGHYKVSREDLFQDVLVHFATHPQRTDTSEADEAVHLLAFRAEQIAIDFARPGAKRNAREESYEAMMGGNQWEAS